MRRKMLNGFVEYFDGKKYKQKMYNKSLDILDEFTKNEDGVKEWVSGWVEIQDIFEENDCLNEIKKKLKRLFSLKKE